MSEGQERSRRIRKPTRFPLSEDSEINYYGYQHTRHSKVSSLGSQEPRTPSLSTNAAARLFVKFLTTANQKLRESRQERDQNIRDNQLGKDNASTKRGGKNIYPVEEGSSVSARGQQLRPKGEKERGESTIGDSKKPVRNSLMGGFNKSGGKNDKNGMKVPDEIRMHPLINQGLRKVYPDPKTIPPSILSQLGISSATLMEQHHVMHQNIKQIIENRHQSVIPSKTKQDMKLFKRSAYHVGIAYYIYMNNIKLLNPTTYSIKNYDPTYPARRLKEQNAKK